MAIPQTPSPLAAVVSAKTYNAQWFSGTTKEAQITNAIAAAVADGALYVYVPANMLPYNASLVTFSTAIRMIAEGRSPSQWNIRAYGAAGDGITDDTVSIQGALTGAGVAGGVVAVPIGRYIITATLNVSSFVSVIGEGADFLQTGNGSIIEVKQNGIMAGVPILNVSNTNWCTIRDLKLVVGGQNSQFNTTRGISDQNGSATYLLIDRCHLQWFGGDAIHLTGGVNQISRNRGNNCFTNFIVLTTAEGGTGSDNYVYFNDSGANQNSNSGDALQINGGAANTVVDNQFYNFSIGIHLLNVASYNRIEGNRCEKAGSNGIQVDGGFGNLLVGNSCFNNGYNTVTGSGIYLSTAVRTTVDGNTCFNDPAFPGGTNQQYGIRLENSANFNDIVGNSLLKSQQYGIYVNLSSTNNSLRGNYSYQCLKDGIFVNSSSSDNAVDVNTVYQCGQGTDNTYNGITVSGSCNNCAFRSNTVRHGGGATQQQFGIRVNSSDCNNTIVSNNDLRTSGRTAPYSDSGTGTLWSVPPGQVTLVDAATIATDASAGTVFPVTIAGNRTMGAPTNAVPGLRITHIITQDAGANRFLVWNAVFENNWKDYNNVANAVAKIEHEFDGTKWRQVSFVGYNGFLAAPVGFATKVLTKTGAYTAIVSDAGVILADATTAGFTITLPFAGNNAGLIYRIKKIDSTANVVTINTGSGNIDGAASKTLTVQYQSLDIQCDGTNWFIF